MPSSQSQSTPPQQNPLQNIPLERLSPSVRNDLVIEPVTQPNARRIIYPLPGCYEGKNIL